MEFSLLTEKDLDAFTEASIAIFNDEPWHDKRIFDETKQYIYRTPHFLGILALEQGKIVDFIYGVLRAWWSGREFYIQEMGVRKEWRNQGIGKALLEQLSQKLEGFGVENLALLTDRGLPAEAFYQKNEFRAKERLIFYSHDL